MTDDRDEGCFAFQVILAIAGCLVLIVWTILVAAAVTGNSHWSPNP
jgi:hypothetical protein